MDESRTDLEWPLNKDEENFLFKMFITADMDLNNDVGNNTTILMSVIKYERQYMEDFNIINPVKILIENGADPNKTNNNHLNSLHMAALNHRSSVNMFIAILESGIDPNIKDLDGDTALHILFNTETEHYNLRTKIKLLIERGADLNLFNDDLETPFYCYMIYGQSDTMLNFYDIMDYLIENGANIDLIDINGETYLHQLININHNEIDNPLMITTYIDYLLKKNANPNILNNAGYSPLQRAIMHLGDELPQFDDNITKYIIKNLLKYGANPDVIREDGWTSLMITNDLDVIRMLVNANADTSIKNDDDEDVFDLIQEELDNSSDPNLINILNTKKDILESAKITQDTITKTRNRDNTVRTLNTLNRTGRSNIFNRANIANRVGLNLYGIGIHGGRNKYLLSYKK